MASANVLSNIGVLEAKLPFDMFNKLAKAIDDLSSDAEKYNNNLLGHMKEEYSLNQSKEIISEYVEALAVAYDRSNPGYIEAFEEVSKSKYYKFYLDTLWVNKQKKYEFNPVHHHAGALSFVIWIKIPYDLKEEETYFPPVSGETEESRTNTHTSKFAFVYTDTLGRIRHIPLPIDKNWEGTILMFPSSMHHCVYPFYTSDDYRISVSGNVRIDGIK